MDFREAKSAARQQRSKNLRYKGRGRGKGGSGSSVAQVSGPSDDDNDQNEGDGSHKRGGRRLDLPSNADRYEDSDDDTGVIDISKLSSEERAALALQPRSEGNNYEELLADRYDDFLIQGPRHHLKSTEPSWEFVDVLFNTNQNADDTQSNLLSVDLQALGESLSQLPISTLLGIDPSYLLQIDESELMVGVISGDGDEYESEDQELSNTDYDFSEEYETLVIPNDLVRGAHDWDGNPEKKIEVAGCGENRPSMSTEVPSIESQSLMHLEIEGREPLEASQMSADPLSSKSSGKLFGAPTIRIAQNVSTAKVDKEIDILDALLADVEGNRIPSNTIESPKTNLKLSSVSTPSMEHSLISSRNLGVSISMIPGRKVSQTEVLQPPSKEVLGLTKSVNDVRQHAVAKNEENKGVDDDDFDAWMDSI